MEKTYYIYIMTNVTNNALYIGVTNNLRRRVYEHKNKLVDGFSAQYNLCKLVYYESTNDVRAAIEREKQLKRWHREWKMNLIKENNPEFDDLNIN
ncbi:MAG: GIY-YIG nuclease family protein [Candidatus Pacebacteria bacterium]|nr:GIY-YIG nuclease family protein [Candidatus Paceibacterota bacterium]